MKRAIVLAALLTLLWATVAQSAPLRWTWQTPQPQGNDLWSVAYGAGLFVAVGDGGSILTSSDGKDWRLQPAPTLAPLRSVIYANGRFVAVGGRLPAPVTGNPGAEAVIVTSTDGLNWSIAQSGPGPSLGAVTFGKGQFLAVGGCAWPTSQTGRSVFSSADGLAWTAQIDLNAEGFCGVAFGQDRWVAMAAAGSAMMFTSPDGAGWTLTGTAAADEFAGWTYRDVVFANGQFVAVQHYGRVRTSTDGVEWSAGDVMGYGAYLGQMTVAGDRIFVPPMNVSSAAGVTWAPMEAGTRVRSVAYGAGTYVAVGEGGVTVTSTDGATWTGTVPDRLPGLSAITYGGGRYVAVGKLGYSATLPDGGDWKGGTWARNVMREWQAPGYVAVVYGNGRFVTLDGNGGKLDTSADGLAWRRTWETNVPAPGGALLFAGGKFVAGTPKGLVISGDGETWQSVYPGDGVEFTGLAWDGARYLAAMTAADHKERLLLTSTDGETWQARPAPAGAILSLAYGAGKFVAVVNRIGDDRPGTWYLLTSANGVDWVAGADVPFTRIRYENGLFLGIFGDLYTSANGEDWRLQPTAAPVWGAGFQNGRLAVVGPNGSVLFGEPVCGTFLDLSAGDVACQPVQSPVARRIVGGYPDGTFKPEGHVTRAELAKMLTQMIGRAPLPGGPLPFSDSADHWAATAGYLQAVVDAGAMNGYPDGSFRPGGQITRAELIKTVLAASGAQMAATRAPSYSDVRPDEWYASWVAAAEQAGLIGPRAVSGLWPETELAPDQPATRAEAVRLLVYHWY